MTNEKNTHNLSLTLNHINLFDGGYNRGAENMAKQLRSEGHSVLLLLGNTNLWTLSNFGTNIEARYQHKNFYALIKDLIKINIDLVHIHQDIYFPFEIIDSTLK